MSHYDNIEIDYEEEFKKKAQQYLSIKKEFEEYKDQLKNVAEHSNYCPICGAELNKEEE